MTATAFSISSQRVISNVILQITSGVASGGPAIVLYCHPDQFRPTTHLVYHNNGDNTFTDVSKTCGFAAAPGKGLGIAFNDFDRDGWPDILVANDSFPQQLFRNKHDGTFEEIGRASCRER